MKVEATISLYFSNIAVGGTSDKVYSAQLVKSGNGYVVNYQHAGRGEKLHTGTKTPKPVTIEEASVIFERLMNEKVKKGYLPVTGAQQPVPVAPAIDSVARTKFPVEELAPITEAEAEAYVRSPHYVMEVKFDGERLQIERTAKGYAGFNKLGNSTSIPAEVVAELEERVGHQRLDAHTYLLDGEIVGKHYFAYDLLMRNGVRLTDRTYKERRLQLRDLLHDVSQHVAVAVVWETTREKRIGLQALRDNNAEGAVFKKLDAPYRPGRNSHKKLKFWKSCSCKVIRVGDKGHDSATLALLDGKRWVEVGRASTIGKGTVQVGALVEVEFLNATAGRRLYQPHFKMKAKGQVWVRTDVLESECTIAQQLQGKYKQGIAA